VAATPGITGIPFSTTEISVGVIYDGRPDRRLARTLAADHIVEAWRATSIDQLDPSAPPPDAVVVFLARVGRPERRLFGELATRLPLTALVVVMADPDAGPVRLALEAGADAVVAEAELERCLGSAVRAACAGQLALPRSFRVRFAQPVLTPREKQV